MVICLCNYSLCVLPLRHCLKWFESINFHPLTGAKSLLNYLESCLSLFACHVPCAGGRHTPDASRGHCTGAGSSWPGLSTAKDLGNAAAAEPGWRTQDYEHKERVDTYTRGFLVVVLVTHQFVHYRLQ